MGPAQLQTMRISGVFTPDARVASGLRLRIRRADHEFHQFDLSCGADRSFPAVFKRAQLSCFVYFFEVARLCVELQRCRLGAAFGGGRKRSGAESVQSGCRTRAIAFRCAASIRVQRHLRNSCVASRLVRRARAVLGGWQLNTIANFSSGTPFTVYDSANVSLQGSSPEITGFYSSRPDLIAGSERRSAYARSVGEPLGFPAVESADCRPDSLETKAGT